MFATASHDSTIRVTRAHDCHLCAILGDDISTAKVKEVMFSYDASNIVALSYITYSILHKDELIYTII